MNDAAGVVGVVVEAHLMGVNTQVGVGEEGEANDQVDVLQSSSINPGGQASESHRLCFHENRQDDISG